MPRVDADLKLDFKDVLLRPKRSSLKSRSENSVEILSDFSGNSLLSLRGNKLVDLVRSFTFRNSKQSYTGIPIIVANMDTVGTFEMAEVMTKHSMFTAIHKHYSLEDWKLFAANHPECLEHVAVSSGSGQSDLERLTSIIEAIPLIKYICLDVANGYSEHFVEFVKNVRAKFPSHTIMAGNVVTGEMVEELILSGADIIKVGIGPGSVCTTRIKTGVGYPQLSAVIECADSAHGLKGHIISDGGCSCPGDVAKAFGAGADFVMLGGMFAGHDQCAGEIMEKNGRKVKLFYGMSSGTAMKKHSGGVAEYRASEGKTVEVPYRGDVENTILDILGGLRSTCTYVGAAKLKELSRRTTFIRVTQQHNQVFL
ncbi:GMP reductase 1 isoform X1 [Alligator mississippiensis]|uniref:GMP reductase 1 isoform X1 n=1 Tax=Alligator mississippiensis TaxID=8496 RepID=UPI000711E44A|nr:GMP reductase 1 isoform X1 [Alligator mississippiensis]